MPGASAGEVSKHLATYLSRFLVASEPGRPVLYSTYTRCRGDLARRAALLTRQPVQLGVCQLLVLSLDLRGWRRPRPAILPNFPPVETTHPLALLKVYTFF